MASPSRRETKLELLKPVSHLLPSYLKREAKEQERKQEWQEKNYIRKGEID